MPLPASRLVGTGDLDKIHQLAGGNAPHRVEVLQQPKVGSLKMVEILSGSGKGLFDIAAR